ncbi:MAG: NERD domain-containing protein [Geobacter sp.]|nr:NERD domain-containing protein [Geobacter sp.]
MRFRRPTKLRIYGILRLFVLLVLSVLLAGFINSKNYTSYFNKMMFRLHTDRRLTLEDTDMPERIAGLLLRNDTARLQQILNGYSQIIALVVTDCISLDKLCPEQRILHSTNPALIWNKSIKVADLNRYPFVPLRQPLSPATKAMQERIRQINPLHPVGGKIIGRVYAVRTFPASFAEDYKLWLRHPFEDNGPWRSYLATMVGCLASGFSVWLIMELFLKIRFMERQRARERELELMSRADTALTQLEEKETQLRAREQAASWQMESYIGRIRNLERQLRDKEEYREIAAGIIIELEEEKERQSELFRQEMGRTNLERQSLLDELKNYRLKSESERETATMALEKAIAPQFANVFEKMVHEAVTGSSKGRKGDWLALHHFDVALGEAGSQFVDCLVISRECLMVIEAKYYGGTLEAEGDVANTRWFSRNHGAKKSEIKSSWGDNPYHQVREYATTLFSLIRERSPWKLHAYGIIVFPAGADITAIGDKLGKYYRITTLDRLVATLDHIEAEARRENIHTRRPTPEQVEELIRGRNMGKLLRLKGTV